MKIAVLLAAILIAASPVYAKSKSVKPAEPVCVRLDDVEKKIGPKVKVERKLVGDDLKKFNDFIKSKGGNAPDNDGLLLLSKPDSEFWMAVQSTKGCVDSVFPVSPESFNKLFDASKEDGKI